MGIVRLFQEGGVTMYPLALCSIIALAVVLDRWLALLRAQRFDTRELLDHLRDELERGNIAHALSLCSAAPGPVARVLLAGLRAYGEPKEVIEDFLHRARTVQLAQLEGNLSWLGTISTISPFLGLFGTVLGIQHAFRQIGAQGSVGIAVVGQGVAEALVTTAVGLGIAIPTVVAYNALRRGLESLDLEMELAGAELVYLLTREVAERDEVQASTA